MRLPPVRGLDFPKSSRSHLADRPSTSEALPNVRMPVACIRYKTGTGLSRRRVRPIMGDTSMKMSMSSSDFARDSVPEQNLYESGPAAWFDLACVVGIPTRRLRLSNSKVRCTLDRHNLLLAQGPASQPTVLRGVLGNTSNVDRRPGWQVFVSRKWLRWLDRTETAATRSHVMGFGLRPEFFNREEDDSGLNKMCAGSRRSRHSLTSVPPVPLRRWPPGHEPHAVLCSS
jgi:hypothetical protein